MTREQETVDVELPTTVGSGVGVNPHGYYYSLTGVTCDRDLISVHALWVPEKSDNDVVVCGIWRDGTNMLPGPVPLTQLNRLLLWLDWTRAVGACVQLLRSEKLMIRVTRKVEIPYHERQLDQAYAAWLDEFRQRVSGAEDAAEGFASFARHRILNGEVKCEIGQCDDRAVVGVRCEKHKTL